MIEQASLVIGEGNWAVKSDSLLGYKINGGKYYPREMSVVRATTGTRINEDGLVELVPYNLVQYSETFASPWGALSGASVSANTAVSPNGQNTAATFSVTSTAFSGFIQTLGSNAQNISIYAKKDTLDYLWIVDESISAIGASYNLATGAVTYTASGHTATIESVGNGWYRCTISHPTNGWEYMQFGLSNASNSGSSPSGGNAYIWGAQAVEGSSALDYLPTTDRLDVARIDYSSGSGALLVEPQRTNLVTYSSSFDNWVNAGGTVTSNTTTAPDGKITADTLTGARFQSGFASNQYTASCFAKKVDGDNLFQLRLDVPSTVSAVFNLNIGTVVSVPSGYSATITAFENGWYLCSITTPPSTAISNFVIISASASASSTFVWGAQMELGSYPTSYIPTQAATVTRNADVISKTGISSLINSEEGVLYAEIKGFISQDTIEPNRYITLTNGTSNERVSLLLGGNLNQLRAIIYSSTQSMNLSFTTSLTDVKQYNKLAVKYKSGDYAFFVNGVKIGGSIITNAFPSNTLTKLSFDIGDGTQQFRGYAKGVIVYNTALTDAELATLTTI